jgi:glycosyltransferase involved in cell wall biosynthesis
MSSRPLISVIIPTCGALEYLKLALPEFLKCQGCEVIIGLDGDNALYRDYLRQLPVRLSVTARRQGACTTTNLAAAVARGKHLFFCNDDMVPAPGWDAALLAAVSPGRVVSATCWEPGLIEVPPCHQRRDFGHEPATFRREEFFIAVATSPGANTEPGVNYPFLIPKAQWDKVGGLDERFNPGSASDPDLFIRLRLAEPNLDMIRTRQAVFYHFASRSSSYQGGRVSLSWKIHRRHGRYMFLEKWGRMWNHAFGEVPDMKPFQGLTLEPEPLITGMLWRRLWFGPRGAHRIIEVSGND